MQKKNLVLAISLALTTGAAFAQDNSELSTVTVEDSIETATPIQDYQELSRSTSTDLKDVLADEVGVEFGGGNGASQWITIRGMAESEIDIVVDDTSSTSRMFHHQSRFSLDPALVEIIEVEKGTGSASAGIGATSGRIVAKTVDAGDLLEDGKDFGARINGGVSSNKGHGGGVAVYGRSGGFDGIVIANWNRDKNYEDGDGGESPYNDLGSRSFLVKGAYNIDDNNRIELSHRREEQYGTRALREEFLLSSESRNSARYRKRTNDTTNLSYEGSNLGALGEIEANIFYTDNDQAEPSKDTTIYAKSTGANLGLTTPVGITGHKVKYGFNWRSEKIGGEQSSYDDEKKTDSGVYVEGIWDFEPFTLTTGLRYDHFKYTTVEGNSTSDGDINPSVGVIWDVSDNFSLNASYNIATRSPQLQEAFFANRDSVVYVDDNVKAETSKNAEIGFSWDYNGFSVEGAVYYQTIEDLQSVNRDDLLTNEGTLKNKGYELGASYTWNGLTARAGIADSSKKLDGTTYDNIAVALPLGRQFTTGLSYQFENPKLELGWRGRYAERSDYIDSDGDEVIRHGYGVHDIYLNWQPTGKDNFNVNFAIENVGDKFYRSQSQRSFDATLAEPGRNFRLNFNYSF